MRTLMILASFLLACPLVAQGDDSSAKFEAIREKVRALRGAEDRTALAKAVVKSCEEFQSRYPDSPNIWTVRSYIFQLAPEVGKTDETLAWAQNAIAEAKDDSVLLELYRLLKIAVNNKVDDLKNSILAPGKTAPGVTLHDIHNGEEVTLADFAGKWVLMDFWATWCGPCKRLMADKLNPFWEKHGEEGDIVILSVGTSWRGDTPEKQLAFAEDKGYDWPKAFDTSGNATKTYMVEGIPFCVLIDPEGKIVTTGNGFKVIVELEKIWSERTAHPDHE